MTDRSGDQPQGSTLTRCQGQAAICLDPAIVARASIRAFQTNPESPMPNRFPRPAQRASFQKTALSGVVSIAAAATIAACQPTIGTPVAGTAESPPVPVVTVAPVLQRSVEPQFAQVGRVEAAQRIEIRPRVAGHIEAALFREGEIVRAGQPLF